MMWLIKSSFEVAYSREERKLYVQDILKNKIEKVKNLILNKNGIIFICGDAAGMGKGKGITHYDSLHLYDSYSMSHQLGFISHKLWLIMINLLKGIQKVLMEAFGNEEYFKLLKNKIIREDLWR